MAKLKEILYVPTDRVIRDENQPRQHFNAFALGRLSDSIKKIGIREPLAVEALPDGTYKLIDGERRWRSAQAIGLKEVPVLVEAKMADHDRVIQQFHLQEMHEAWRPDEKAIAIKSLADTLECTFTEAAEMVGLSKNVSSAYRSLMELTHRDKYLSHGLPIERASSVVKVVKTAKNQLRRQLNVEMPDEMAVQLEEEMINRLISGEFKNGEQFRTLSDSFVKDAKNVAGFLKGKTASSLFIASDAQGVRAYRYLKNSASSLAQWASMVSRSKDALALIEEDSEFKSRVKSAIKSLERLI